MAGESKYVRWFETLSTDDTSIVGGKNSSLGEMIRDLKNKGVRIPNGFATTADAYREFVQENDIKEKISSLIDDLKNEKKSLEKVGKAIRRLFLNGEFPEKIG